MRRSWGGPSVQAEYPYGVVVQYSAFLGVCKGEATDPLGVRDRVEPRVVRAEHDTVCADLPEGGHRLLVADGRRPVDAVDKEAAVEEDVRVGVGQLFAGGAARPEL